MDNNEDHVTEYTAISDNIFIGSNMCIGPNCPVHCSRFKELGVRGEVNLEMERDESPSPCVDAYLWLPVPDHAAPTLEQLMIGTAAMNEMIARGMKVYVHCEKGHGRSPTMVAAYLIRYENKTVDEAVSTIWEKRQEIHLEEVQMKALEDFYNL